MHIFARRENLEYQIDLARHLQESYTSVFWQCLVYPLQNQLSECPIQLIYYPVGLLVGSQLQAASRQRPAASCQLLV